MVAKWSAEMGSYDGLPAELPAEAPLLRSE
jgi:hypothetical protein